MKCPHCATAAYIDWKEVVFPVPSPEEDYDRGGMQSNMDFVQNAKN